jgi:hypothetical protein
MNSAHKRRANRFDYDGLVKSVGRISVNAPGNFEDPVFVNCDG